MGTIIGDGITFDDVLLVPAYSEVIPNQVDLTTYLTKTIKLSLIHIQMCIRDRGGTASRSDYSRNSSWPHRRGTLKKFPGPFRRLLDHIL